MKRVLIAALLLMSATAASAADISTIRCTFKAEGFEGGKSNTVSCAMSPNEVLSSNTHPQAAAEMCDQKSNLRQENYENYVVDLAGKTVRYDAVSFMSDFAKAEYISHSVRKGESRERATNDANKKRSLQITSRIDSFYIGSRPIYFRVGGGVYNPPKELPSYVVRYGESSLYFTDGVPEATIIEVTGNERHTWVNIKFGLCESE